MEDVAGKYGPDIYTDFLLDFMERHQSEPFFVYFPMTLAHFPFVHTPGTAEGGSKQENFAKMVPYMDMLVGRIVRKLEVLGLRENTLLVFTGDNGTDRNQASQWKGKEIKGGKGNMTDAGTRVPLIVSWPGTTPTNRQVNDLVDLSDMLPTFAEAAGVDIPPSHKIDGRSILARLKGEGAQKRDWIFCQLGDQWFFRNKDYRLHQDGTFYRMKDFYEPNRIEQDNAETEIIRRELEKAAKKFGLIK
jgi:arylsulfatase A